VETVTADTNTINLDTESYNLLVNQCGILMAQQNQGSDATFDVNFFRQAYLDGVRMYKSRYKSEILPPQQSYYRVTSPRRFRNL